MLPDFQSRSRHISLFVCTPHLHVKLFLLHLLLQFLLLICISLPSCPHTFQHVRQRMARTMRTPKHDIVIPKKVNTDITAWPFLYSRSSFFLVCLIFFTWWLFKGSLHVMNYLILYIVDTGNIWQNGNKLYSYCVQSPQQWSKIEIIKLFRVLTFADWMLL